MEGRVVAGRYRLDRVLGRGGTGVVWLARDAAGGADVALKLASADIAAHPSARDRFLREARLCAKLVSPHIARIHDHGLTEQGEPFVVMERLTGTNLADELAIRRRLSLADTARVVSGVCGGLACAHEGGVVHRDIKPQNIFLERPAADGSIGHVKILDFGCAKAVDWLADASADPTRTGDIVGTPCYMSPEQASGLTALDFRADLWAVGVVAFECATGVRAFEAPALGPLMAKILTGPIPVPSRAAPDADIPPRVDEWLARVLVRDPGGRPASAQALAESFSAALDEREEAPKAPDGRDESAIRAHLVVGDVASAATTAIEQLGPEILRYLHHVVREQDLVDEAFSDFCERLFRSLPRFEWRSSARTWAYALARAAAGEVLRAERRRRRGTQPLTESCVEASAQHVRTVTWPLLRTERRSALLQLTEDSIDGRPDAAGPSLGPRSRMAGRSPRLSAEGSARGAEGSSGVGEAP